MTYKEQYSNQSNYNNVVAYTPAQKYYEVIQDLIFRINDFIIEGNLRAALITYNRLYNLVYYFIKKYIKDDSRLNPESILADLPNDAKNDYEATKNTRQYYELMARYNKMERTLYILMSKARLFVPINQISDLNKAILETR